MTPPCPSAIRPPLFLALGDDRRIAYHKTEAQSEQANAPGVMFLGGFRSDMTGSKALHLEAWAQTRGVGFLRFDYTGHGASSGAFEAGGIGDWARDAADALTMLTSGPQILVGSSMGGWISLLLAKRHPERIAGFVGIAAAPDFTEDLMWPSLSEAQRAELTQAGRLETPSAYSDEPYVVTAKLIEDARSHLLLREPLRVNGPVRLMHGTADSDVPMSVALRLLAHLDCPNARLTLLKDAGHRLSEPHELTLLSTILDEVFTQI
ncbi:MAG: alpha/beta hydrolase [Rhodobacteraceae bacterium]|nr:alpha/beta hydrolase [Paracoccaceae bacterium]